MYEQRLMTCGTLRRFGFIPPRSLLLLLLSFLSFLSFALEPFSLLVELPSSLPTPRTTGFLLAFFRIPASLFWRS